MKKIICYLVIVCFSMACPGMAVLPAALAAELTSGEEATLIYSKEVLQETLNDIKNKLDAGFPVTTEIIFLEDINNELKRHLVEVESAAEEVRTTVPNIDLTEFEINLEESLGNARKLIYELDNIIINPSMDQIDSALELIELLDPEVQGEILATKPELPNRTVDTKANVFKERPVKATGAPVTEADFAETAEIVFTDAIIVKASELNHDVVDIFTWVKFNIDYEPYYGSMKGSNETLVDMAGNDCDTSSLLLALLRASGIPSRYVRGDVELRIEDLMNWTGGKTPEAAIAIMQRNQIPIEVIYKFDVPEGVIFDHIWVEASDGHNWRIMDPSFKTYVYTEGVGFDVDEPEMLALIEDVMINVDNDVASINNTAVNEYIRSQGDKFTEELDHLTKDEVVGKRKIFVSEKNNLPPYLARGIIGDRKPAEEFAEMPEDMRFKMKAILPGGYEYIASISEIAGKRVSLVYVAAYASHQAYLDSIGGIYNLAWPESAIIQMKPVLQIDGETVAEGTITGLGCNQSLQTGFLRPGAYDPLNPVWEFTNKPLLSGNRYNLSITTQRTSPDEIARLATIVESKIEDPSNGDAKMTNDEIDESLRLMGMYYFTIVDEFTDYASSTLNIVSVNHLSMGYTCSEIKPVWVGFMIKFMLGVNRGGVHIDVVRNVVCPTSTTGNNDDKVIWMGMTGFIGTNAESFMLERFYPGIKAVSTGAIFAEAAKTGIAIHTIRKETLEADLGRISAYGATKNHIRAYVNAGYIAMIPQRSVSVGDWYGQGWIVLNEASGAAGYMICGGLGNETTMISGGSLTKAIQHLILECLHMVHLLKAIAAGTGVLSTGLGLMVAAIYMLEGFAFLMHPAIIFLCGGLLWTLGVIFLCASFLILRQMLESFLPLVYIQRRKKYAYA